MKSVFDTSYMRPVDKAKLNLAIVRELEKHPAMLDRLYNWIILPDHDQLKEVTSFLSVLNRLQKLPPITQLWRGLDPGSSYQDTLGFGKTGWLWLSKLDHVVGEVRQMEITKPVSFTYRQDVAEHYGSTVVSCQFRDVKDQCLVFTDELYYAIATRHRIEPVTLAEVIVLPRPAHPIAITVVAAQ